VARILIVDGHAYAYRAFYAIRSLHAPDGQPTNAIYGFIKMLAKMRARVEPTHGIVVWDGGLCAERVSALPEYKAQRAEMPGDLEKQLDEIGKYLEGAGVAQFCAAGIEADDYIAFVARESERLGWEVVIASSDKDFMQLVSPTVGLLNPNDKMETIWRAEQVRAKTGVGPEQIVDWLSLLGDSVDNIPGVPGIGPKTATELLTRFGSVAELYRRLSEVKSDRIRNALSLAEGTVRRNQELVQLRLKSAEAINLEDFRLRPMNTARLAELFREWGFRSMLAEVSAAGLKQSELI